MTPRPEESIISSPIKRKTNVDQTHLIEAKQAPPCQIVWINVILQTIFHLGALYGIYCCFYAKYQTLIIGNLFL